jgi:predicted nucleic acid-binding protein
MPERRVVDTSVASLFVKLPPDTRALAYLPHIDGKELTISFMTLAELFRWPIERGWGTRQVARLERYISLNYTVHYADEALCRAWADIRAGHQIDTADAWIAATARVRGVPLVTHNRRHFSGIAGVTIISEAPATQP